MLAPGSTLQNRYRILKPIGGGGMGTVYLAVDTRLPGRRCAIKEMSPAQLGPDDLAWATKAFEQEAQMLARLQHPGLTTVTDFFREGDDLYLVMDYVGGETLADRLERMRDGRLPPPVALSFAGQLLDVLEFLHRSSPPVVFRDLKPANVMIMPNGAIKLIDFGIARFFKPGQTRDTMSLGTPGYAAPEQYGGKGQTDPRSDIYSLGILLHQMLTGHDPTAMPLRQPPVSSLNPAIPVEVASAIDRATQLNPDFRFQSIAEFRQAVLSQAPTLPWQTGANVALPSTQPTPSGSTPYPSVMPYMSQPPAAGRSRAPMWIAVGIAGAGVIALAIAASVVLNPPRAEPTPIAQVTAPAVISVAQATDTAAPALTNTPVPVDTPQPTATPTTTRPPTSTPFPSPTPTPPCPAVSGPFAGMWAELQNRLGCATGSLGVTDAADEPFQGGWMYWRKDAATMYAIYRGGIWESHADRWREGDPEFSCPDADTPSESPPTPKRGFGRVWCSVPSVRQGLGAATEGERGLQVTVQSFERGLIMLTDRGTWILYADGTWERR